MDSEKEILLFPHSDGIGFIEYNKKNKKGLSKIKK